jgi:hypothetical protein
MEGRMEYRNGKIAKAKTGAALGGGFLGLGLLACVGCCLPPLGALTAGGLGLALAGFSRFLPWLPIAGLATAGAAFYLALRSKRSARCGNPDCGCAGSCAIRTPEAADAEADAAGSQELHTEDRNAAVTVRNMPPEDPAGIEGCSLTAEAQANRIDQLRSGLFREILSIEETDGKSEFKFADTPEIMQELERFIRFERGCCTSLRFALSREPQGGSVALELEGPTSARAAFINGIRPPGSLPRTG